MGGSLTSTVAPSRPRRRAERIIEMMGIDSNLGGREVVIGGENDQRRSGVDWRSAEWGSRGNFFNLAGFSVTRGG